MPRNGTADARLGSGFCPHFDRIRTQDWGQSRNNPPNRPMRSMMRPLALALLLPLLAACQPNTNEPEVRRADPVAVPLASAPATAGCWATDRVPALTETVFDTDAAGTRHPRDEVLRPAEDRLFAVPCPDQIGPDFIASLQRALAARGLYAGAITGTRDADTAAAIRLYQAPQGLDSGVLSLQAAQQLGLVPVARDAL
jgi:hypothetical protein